MQAADRFATLASLRKTHATEPAKEVSWRRKGNTGVAWAGHNNPIIIKMLLYEIWLKQNISQHRFYQNGTCFRSLKPSSGIYRLQIYRKMQLHKVAISVFVG